MTEDNQLQEQLRRLATEGPQRAGESFEQTMRAAFRAHFNESARRWTYVTRVAVAVVISAGLYFIWAQWTYRRAADQQTGMSAAASRRSEFIALPYAQSEVPLEQPVIVRVQIPVSELGGMGVPFAPAGCKEKVSADLLIGQDGVARAVRVVE